MRMSVMAPAGALALVALAPRTLAAQSSSSSMTIEEYEPRSSLVVPAHPRPRRAMHEGAERVVQFKQ